MRNIPDAGLRPGQEHHAPAHQEYNGGANGRGQRGVHAVNADLRKNGS